jgi:hypothetical protein
MVQFDPYKDSCGGNGAAARHLEGCFPMRLIAQAVLDSYPDCVSQYGLLGCAAFTLYAIAALLVLIRVATLNND